MSFILFLIHILFYYILYIKKTKPKKIKRNEKIMSLHVDDYKK